MNQQTSNRETAEIAPTVSQSELIAALGGKPTEAGEYEIWCEECEEWTPITITAEPWGLLAHCPDTGGHPLDVYHDALTAVMWRKAPLTKIRPQNVAINDNGGEKRQRN